mgnify:CR=1 FL=1
MSTEAPLTIEWILRSDLAVVETPEDQRAVVLSLSQGADRTPRLLAGSSYLIWESLRSLSRDASEDRPKEQRDPGLNALRTEEIEIGDGAKVQVMTGQIIADLCDRLGLKAEQIHEDVETFLANIEALGFIERVAQ